MAVFEKTYPRRLTKPCRIGSVSMGSGHPVVVQSMITEETRNVEACVEQIIALHQAGSEIVRVTTPTVAEAQCLEEIKAKVRESYKEVPMTADVHHQGTEIAVLAAKYVDEIRVNPGLFVFKRHGSRAKEKAPSSFLPDDSAGENEEGVGGGDSGSPFPTPPSVSKGTNHPSKTEGGASGVDLRGRDEEEIDRLRADLAYTREEWAEELAEIEESFVPVIEACQRYDRAMRVGVNHGSLAERLLVTYGDTPEGMVESALEYLRICVRHGFENVNVSAKASRVPIKVAVNRLMARRMDEEGLNFPLHLGVTEAGDGQYARVKSTAGIATLLMEGIGDTIRVSLAEDPVNEIPVCYEILQALGLRKTRVEYIACPSCGRTKFNLPIVLNQVRDATKHLVGLDIAVMGCIVNGPGEMADADYGYVGAAGGKITLYRKREPVKHGIPQERGVEELVNLLKEDGVWVDPPEDSQLKVPIRVLS
ncbi:MAG: (E)-4-hydroxy-3-methylbut-2-enyl-diphosphate synthase [Fimbriimonadaceae bacterium]|nr:(E)-4-hydroxy-3-methylbut-2-enyl-diphosphate synthase [Fimbriimonadaceae bacterium]QYK54913.1 MAG: (E)-4-hydroxy-3-methylbut-2-enyl-diphosphate synthase [Fimbriimonadaceae bacterium]